MTVSRPELLMDGSDHAFREMVHDIMALAARMAENRARVAAYAGLTAQQYTILLTIAHNQEKSGQEKSGQEKSGQKKHGQDQDGFGIIQVAEHLRLSGAFVTIEVNKLVESGLVRKRPNPVDRRRVLLTVLPKGRELLDKLVRVQRPSNDTIFGSLSAESFRTLRQVIPQLVDGSDQSLKLIDFLTSDRGQVAALR